MKPNPICRLLSTSVKDLAIAMKAEGGGPLPIVDINNGNRLVGVITYQDLVHRVLAEGKDAVKTRALDVLSHQKQFCKSDDSISRAITLMDHYHICDLPVVDASLRLVGTIHQGDITRHLEEAEVALDVTSAEDLIPVDDHEVRTIL